MVELSFPEAEGVVCGGGLRGTGDTPGCLQGTSPGSFLFRASGRRRAGTDSARGGGRTIWGGGEEFCQGGAASSCWPLSDPRVECSFRPAPLSHRHWLGGWGQSWVGGLLQVGSREWWPREASPAHLLLREAENRAAATSPSPLRSRHQPSYLWPCGREGGCNSPHRKTSPSL